MPYFFLRAYVSMHSKQHLHLHAIEVLLVYRWADRDRTKLLYQFYSIQLSSSPNSTNDALTELPPFHCMQVSWIPWFHSVHLSSRRIAWEKINVKALLGTINFTVGYFYFKDSIIARLYYNSTNITTNGY